MKLIIILLTTAIVQVSASGFAQNVTLRQTNARLTTVLDEIRSQTGYDFFYSEQIMDKANPVSLNLNEVNLLQALEICFKNQPLTYSIENKTVTIKRKRENILNNTKDAILNLFQNIDVIGSIIGEDGAPLVGATVVIKGSSRSTVTNGSGAFSFTNVDAGATIVITYVGYVPREIAARAKLSGIVLLMLKSKLDEVVVIGYGTSKRKNLTGSVSSITAEDINKQPVQNPLSAMMGRIAGVNVTQSTGYASSRVDVNIRGAGSLALGGGNTPLFVVDGVPFNLNDAGTYSNLNNGGIQAAGGYQSPFAMLNPDDIERIDVLKDADATAIYGSRGANGVVLITTKKAESGATKVNVNLMQGLGKVSKFIDMLNTQQYLDLRREAFKNDGITPGAAANPDLFTWDQNAYTDWQRKYLGGTAGYTDAQFNITGGNGSTKFLFSTAYHRESTVLPSNAADQRFSGRFNLDHSSADKRFNMSLNSSYAYDQSDLNSTDISSLYKLPPNMPVFNADGSLYWDPTQTFNNPEALLRQLYLGKTNNLLSNLSLRYHLVKGLEIKTNVGLTTIELNQRGKLPASTFNPATSPVNAARFANTSQSALNIEPQITYDLDISKGKLSLLGGATILRSQNQSQYFYDSNYPNAGLMDTPAGAATYTLISGSSVLYKYFSLFGRATYNWDEKYIINGTFRRDGSSKFGPDNRFGNFGSIGAAWIFTKENWLGDNQKILSFGKLRASYGVTGNDQFADYKYLALYSSTAGSSAYQGNASLYPSALPNPNLKWETNKKLDIGVELGFLSDRIHLNTTYYRNRSDNQANSVALPTMAGLPNYFGNIPALIQSRGFEFELNSTNINSKSFQWKTTFNLTLPNSKILAVDPHYRFAQYLVLGYPLDQINEYDFLYVDPQNGVPVYRSSNGESTTPDGTIGSQLQLSLLPTSYGGLINDFQYKNFTFSFALQFSRQKNNVKTYGQPGILSTGNFPLFVLDRWRNPGDVTVVPKASTRASLYSDYYNNSDATWGDNSYLRLQNASLSYNIPANVNRILHLSALRLFMQGQNLYVWTKNKTVYDPMTSTSYPPLRIITFGVNCTF